MIDARHVPTPDQERAPLSLVQATDGEGPEGDRDGAADDPLTGFAHLVDIDRDYHDAKSEMIERFERQYLIRKVSRTGGNLSAAARRSGVDRATIYRLMQKHDLSRSAMVPGESSP